MKLLTPFSQTVRGILHQTDRTLHRNLLKNGDNYDKTLLWTLLCLLCFGLVMVYSASAATAGLVHYENRFMFFMKQLQFALAGLALCFLLMRVPMWRWQRWTKFILIFWFIVLFLVPFIGDTVNGAKRWLMTPFGFKIQPSEIFKLITIMYMADFATRKQAILNNYKDIWAMRIPIPKTNYSFRIPIPKAAGILIPVTAGAILIAMTRDFGSVVVIMVLAVLMLYWANMPKTWFFIATFSSIAIGAGFIVSSPFRMRRMMVMWQPWEDPTGTGYQVLGSLLSMERGGLFGNGLGNAIFKRGFLPEAHTDFILAVIGEELGWVTIAFLVLVYCWIIWRAFCISNQARHLHLLFNSFMAFGISLLIASQSFVNIGVNISLLPNKGLTLPLISYGGSSLIMILIAFTMLLRIDYENRRKIRGYNVADPKFKSME